MSAAAATLSAEFWALTRWDLMRHGKWMALMFLANSVGFADHDLALLTCR